MKKSPKNTVKDIIAFRDARDWKKFHNPKDLSLSLSLEASELLEHFQWKNEVEQWKHVKKAKDAVGDEMADIYYWLLLMSSDFGIDLEDALKRKMKINEKKYPVKKAKGNARKYYNL